MTEKRQDDNNQSGKIRRELLGLFAIFSGILLFLSLGSFDVRDPWLNHVVSESVKIQNRVGLLGAYLSGFLFDLFGIAAWVVPVFFCLWGIRKILNAWPWGWWRWCGFLTLMICLAMAGAAKDLNFADFLANTEVTPLRSTHKGGFLGYWLYSFLVNWLSLTGTGVLWLFFMFLSVHLLLGSAWLGLFYSLIAGSVTIVQRIWQKLQADRNVHKQKKTSPVILDVTESSEKHSLDRNTAKESDKAITLPDDPNLMDLPNKNDEGHKLGLGKPWSFLHWSKKSEEEPEWIKDFEDGFTGDTESNIAPISLEEQAELQRQATLVVAEKKPPVAKAPAVHIAEVKEVELATLPGKTKSILQNLVNPGKAPLPSVNLLDACPNTSGSMTRAELESKGRNLMTCLTDFGIQCDLVGITPGPVVTVFELRPAPGVRVSRIANLSDDLALALKAVAVRVQAPIPGTDTVGIEIPNEVREVVCFKELVKSKIFQQSPSLLTLALGKDTSGEPSVANLATMPHLLVAGATGAGKSVGINSILLSIILKARPEEVKLLLVDPKRVEMAIYADLPHLVHPVVTEMSTAKNALDWAVMEMEKRYNDIAKAGVRNIADYNEKLSTDKSGDLAGLEPMPYLVIVIDELADLMLVAAKEVETSIVRLAQLARAAGIHLILATQRPSVDVVTGLIKANFPCRIAFQVTSKHDSRTILDTVGAEYLLGKGDMLFKPSGGKFQRLHGAFVSDKNVNAIVGYWKSKQKPDYSLDFTAISVSNDNAGFAGAGADDILGDPLYAEACEFIRQQDKVSISLIQRRFRIGFNKAARFVEQMEQDGIVTPADGAKPRTVVR